ncbi:hypothetical protein Tco_0574195 [Tanacetum coccineum]
MLISDNLIIDEIQDTQVYKDYKEKYGGVEVPMIQPEPFESTQGTPTAGETNSPRKSLKIRFKQQKAISTDIPPLSDDRERDEIHEETLLSLALHKTTKIVEEQENIVVVENKILEEDVDKILEGEDEESYASEFAEMVLLDKEDSGTRLEPESHKENLKEVDDDDDEDETKDDKKDDNDDDQDDHALIRNKRVCSLEIRNEKMQTPTSSPPRSPRKDLSLNKTITQELTVSVTPTLATTSQDHSKPISSRCKILPGTKFEKSSASADSCIDDAFRKRNHDEHQGDDGPPEGEKKRQQQQQECHAWVEDPVINEDEVIPEDETPEIIEEFQNVDKRVPTIFDREKIKATLRDMLSNQFRDAEEYAYHLEQSQNYMENQIVWESRQDDLRRSKPNSLIFYGPQRNLNKLPRYLYNKDLFFLKYGNTEEKSCVIWERVHDFQLGIESYHIKINLTAPTLIFPSIKECDPFSILEELSKFYNDALEKMLNEVKLKIFQIEFLKKAPLLGSLDLMIMKAYEREIKKRLSHHEQMRRWDSFVNGRPIL